VATIEDPGGLQVGDVTIHFSVSDRDSSFVTLNFLYSGDGGITWHPASIKYSSVGTAYDNTVAVSGVSVVLVSGYCVWDSFGDGVATNTLETNVRVAVYAEDEQRVGQRDTTRGFVLV
jgi:hypothetical protein